MAWTKRCAPPTVIAVSPLSCCTIARAQNGPPFLVIRGLRRIEETRDRALGIRYQYDTKPVAHKNKAACAMNKITSEFSEFVLFSEDEVRALEEREVMRESRGKQVPYVKCLVRDKEVQLKPEERTRQLWLAHLIDKLGYARSRIAIEYPITFGRDSSKRADIVVFDADRPTVPYIIVEVKQAKYKDGKEQLR
ncbi:type I restriction enzyme HsdR N-terminal domain-containing protein, partial [Paracoccus sp. (in: a-proteobacteria)]|uniref:type I restriction enzyme HsdR N-terminal domain-containing protein n=1 Tax=Paracoccus sp. TaxID=267 RepID=UPI00321FE8DF